MITKETAYLKIAELVKRFDEQYDSYKKSGYNETQTRRDFIDPFFKALGWDTDNEQGYSEAYREVIHEDRVKVEGLLKAPDYSFRIGGGKRLFFVEAKKPSVLIREEIYPAYQVRRYGWNAKLSISIITDFEEFAIYDCTKKPKPSDKASVARIEYFMFREYLQKFDFIWNTFSKEQVLKGSFDRYIQSSANKKGTTPVDQDFLQSLNQWRTYLATSISWNNKNLSEDELNFAVQQTLDRIIFLRIAEARNVDIQNSLANAIKSGDYYQNLFNLFREADEKYNSGLFDLKKDKISANLKIDNKVIKTIINELYYPASPYEFSVLSVEILGTAYEQFLGKVIRIDQAHRAKIEEKPEVRKAGGVYYTPEYIVDYIVQNTVGKAIEGKTPELVSELKIVDPACGSGSFLIGAYQYLIDWHKRYYDTQNSEIKRKGAKVDVLNPDGNLTSKEKKRILLNNIYGVDIDVNAVEVTKLSLLLKCMEGETEASINHQLSMFHERLLPDLDNNIKSGNSLIDADFYDGQLDFEPLIEKRIKPFNWQKAFPEVFKPRPDILSNDFTNRFKHIKKQYENNQEDFNHLVDKHIRSVHEPNVEYGQNSGFDIVLGNPPYFSLSTVEMVAQIYYQKKFRVFERSTDIYCLFSENALNILRPEGVVGFITSNQWLQTNYGKVLRKYLIEKANPEILINFGGTRVFQDATVDTSILIVRKTEFNNWMEACMIKSDYVKGNSVSDYFKGNKIVLKNLETERWTIETDSKLSLKDKIRSKGRILKLWPVRINYGIKTGFNEAFIINQEIKNQLIEEESKAAGIIKPMLRGRDVHKYVNEWAELYLILTKNGININDYPSIKKHLDGFKVKLINRADQGENWWNLRSCNYYELFETPKIIYPETTVRRSEFYYDTAGYYIDKTCFMITGENLPFLNGILSSKLMEWFLESELRSLGKHSIQYSKQYIEQIPVPAIDGKNNYIVEEISKLALVVTSLYKDLKQSTLTSQKEQIQTKIDFCENQINQLVYQLYDLSDDEVKIVIGV